MKSFLSQHWISFIAPSLFLLLKLSSVSLRLSDTNVYFYTAYQILQGKLLYADIFFTNFPLFPYLSAIYLAISGNNIYFYYFTASIEVAITSLCMYAIVIRQWDNKQYAIICQILYLFSFIILATSDHQSGVFMASLFAVISYFFFQRKNIVLVGGFVAFAVLTKAYFLPLVATYGMFFLLKERKSLLKFIFGFGVTIGVVLTPFLLFAREGIIQDIFFYSLTRGSGTSKTGVLQFFIFRDILLFSLLLINLFVWRKYLFFSLFSVFSILFILLYQDIYYLYLNIMVPFLIISFPLYQSILTKKMNLQRMVIPSLIVCLLFFNFFIYITQYRSLQNIPSFHTLVEKIENSKPEYIYGANDIAPLLAYMTEIPLLNKTIDTNANIFRKGILDADTMTESAINHKTIVIVHGVSFPHYGVEDQILDEIVVKNKISTSCDLIHSHPVYAEGITNRVNLFQCFK